jgi:hypothetical protein
MTMKHWLALGALAALSGFAPQQKAPFPGWFTDTAQAFREARATGKPLFIVFR